MHTVTHSQLRHTTSAIHHHIVGLVNNTISRSHSCTQSSKSLTYTDMNSHHWGVSHTQKRHSHSRHSNLQTDGPIETNTDKQTVKLSIITKSVSICHTQALTAQWFSRRDTSQITHPCELVIAMAMLLLLNHQELLKMHTYESRHVSSRYICHCCSCCSPHSVNNFVPNASLIRI